MDRERRRVEADRSGILFFGFFLFLMSGIIEKGKWMAEGLWKVLEGEGFQKCGYFKRRDVHLFCQVKIVVEDNFILSAIPQFIIVMARLVNTVKNHQ